ncbi:MULTISPECIES: carboxymuconolactone decarboxylase family protein [unclassified Luteococcus]|uniref:carboxymuconolactone decarboxylase family protein n=1 Tax=unclassified Luteococcus TaxID=2639923 RepID=UPI00313DDAFB
MTQNRTEQAAEVFGRLFNATPPTSEPDPEFGPILRKVIFSDVFATGDLDDRTRELVTVTCLAALQTLPQLKAHATAALNVGVTPVELREAMYQLAPIIGFPRTLNAIGVVSEVITAAGHELPLQTQGTTTDEDRHELGLDIQTALYGTEIADALAGLPEPFDRAVPGFLTDFHFGDFWTREGLDRGTRELLALVTLAALNLAPQLPAHVRGCLKAGNSVETVLAALVQAFPYIGYPSALNAMRVVLAETGSRPQQVRQVK